MYKYKNIIVALFIFIVMNNHSVTFSSTFENHSIDLKGVASGGSLKFIDTMNQNARYISIETFAGEPADKVSERLAKALNESDLFGWWGDIGHATKDSGVIFKGNSIERLPGPVGMFAFAGTEKGLGIPYPPTSLSCTYDSNEEKIILNWENPPEKYDRIYIMRADSPFPISISPATSTRYTIENKEININNMFFSVMGFRNNTPSNIAAINVSSGGKCQEELYGIPFTNNIAPNWSPWSTESDINKSAFEQGQKYPELTTDNKYRQIKSFSTKTFFQIIKSPGKNKIHGVYRKFLGLIPGHIYRLTACINTLEMDTVEGYWDFSMYAVLGSKNLTSQQMADPSPLIENSVNNKNIQILSYGPGRTTKSEFNFAITGYTKLPNGQISSNIVLPDKIGEITVWLKFVCEDPNGSVACSGVKLEDITEIKNPKSPEQIIEEENGLEIELLRRIERESL